MMKKLLPIIIMTGLSFGVMAATWPQNSITNTDLRVASTNSTISTNSIIFPGYGQKADIGTLNDNFTNLVNYLRLFTNLTFLTDGSMVGDKSAWGGAVSVTNIGASSYGAVQRGSNAVQNTLMVIGSSSVGAEQSGLCATNSKMVIGNISIGAIQRMWTATGGVASNIGVGCQQYGAVNANGIISIYDPSASIFGAYQAGYNSGGIASNSGIGSIQLFNLSVGQKAYITYDAYGSIGLGASTVSHPYSIVAGDGNISYANASVSADSFWEKGTQTLSRSIIVASTNNFATLCTNLQTEINIITNTHITNLLSGSASITITTNAGTRTINFTGSGSGDFLANGSVPMTGPLNFGGQKGTNMADGTSAKDAMTLGQFNSSTSGLGVAYAAKAGLWNNLSNDGGVGDMGQVLRVDGVGGVAFWTLGTAASSATGDFANAAQGLLADTALQPAGTNAIATVITAHSNSVTAHGLVTSSVITNNATATITITNSPMLHSTNGSFDKLYLGGTNYELQSLGNLSDNNLIVAKVGTGTTNIVGTNGFPIFRAAQSLLQPIAANVDVLITCTNNIIDTHSGYSTNTYIYTMPVGYPGYYEVNGCLRFILNSSVSNVYKSTVYEINPDNATNIIAAGRSSSVLTNPMANVTVSVPLSPTIFAYTGGVHQLYFTGYAYYETNALSSPVPWFNYWSVKYLRGL